MQNTTIATRTEGFSLEPGTYGDILEVIDYETDEHGSLLAQVRLDSLPGRVHLVDVLDLWVARAA